MTLSSIFIRAESDVIIRKELNNFLIKTLTLHGVSHEMRKGLFISITVLIPTTINGHQTSHVSGNPC